MDLSSITFRYAKKDDISLIYSFIKKLADYEGMSEAVKVTEESLNEWLFERKCAEVVFVMADNREVGFSLFFENFAAYTGRGGIFIDDLYVEPDFRGRGIGKALFQKMAEIALERGGVRLEWLCLKENKPSIGFYQHMGATLIEECAVFRATGEALKEILNK